MLFPSAPVSVSIDPAFKKNLLALAQVPGIGAVRLRSLIEKFGSPDAALGATTSALAAVEGIGQTLSQTIHRFARTREKVAAALSAAEAQLEKADKLGATLLTLWDADYPPQLRQIYDPPAYFFLRGSLMAQDNRSVAFVGTRHPTDYGRNATKRLVQDLAAHHLTIVSGLAIGIDTEAHTAALASGTRTIAVLGAGVDIIYTDPKGKLYPRIIESGAIMSEELIGTEPVAENFPKRNRIISALSLGSVIVESDYRGGALITAKYALEQNREVFAVPGNIFSRKSNGTNALIRNGHAKLVLSAEDILSEVGVHLTLNQTGHSPLNSGHAAPAPAAVADLAADEAALYALFSDQPIHIDAIAEQSGRDISDVLVLLFELEMKELITQSTGKFFRKR